MSFAFAGMCLQNSREFDLNSIFFTLKNVWNIKVNADSDGYTEEPYLVKFKINDTTFIVKYVDFQVPIEEVKVKSVMSEMDEEFTNLAINHISHVAVGAVTEANPVETASDFCKVVSSVLSEPYSIGVMTPSKIIDSNTFVQETMFLKQDYLPIYNLINVSYKEDKSGISAFTTGLKDFGKPEMEILDSDKDIDTVQMRLYNIAYYIIDNDKELIDEETLTLQEQDEEGNTSNVKFDVEYNDGINIKGKTVKVYEL